MNQDPSVDLSTTTAADAEAISRRAYEIWEREGRPDGCDLRHWLDAEQELRTQASGATGIGSAAATSTQAPRNTGNDTRPLQGTRAAAAANREPRRGSNSPFSTEKSATANPSSAVRRKPSNSPVL